MNDLVRFIDMAVELGIGESTLDYHCKMGRIPKPTKVFGVRVFDLDSVKSVRHFFASRQRYEHTPKQLPTTTTTN